jgi:hypothetical protein
MAQPSCLAGLSVYVIIPRVYHVMHPYVRSVHRTFFKLIHYLMARNRKPANADREAAGVFGSVA